MVEFRNSWTRSRWSRDPFPSVSQQGARATLRSFGTLFYVLGTEALVRVVRSTLSETKHLEILLSLPLHKLSKNATLIENVLTAILLSVFQGGLVSLSKESHKIYRYGVVLLLKKKKYGYVPGQIDR